MRADPTSNPAAALAACGVAVVDEFIGPPRVADLVRCAQSRRARGEFGAAGIGAAGIGAAGIGAACIGAACIGAGARRRLDAGIRGDMTCWLEEPLFSVERTLLDDLEQLRLAINRDCFLGLFDLEAHYAWYPPGAGYDRHVDQLAGRSQRLVSLVVYLNEAWPPDGGGALRLFDGAQAHDIEPVAGRLVLFLTEGREHAVLTTHHDRLSVTGWFRSSDSNR